MAVKNNKGCPEFPYFGAKYPDATCINGTLHDLDDCDENGNVYLKDERHPCPFCNTQEFKEQWGESEHAEIDQWIEETRNKYS